MSRKSKKEVEAIVSGMGVFMSFISSLIDLVKKLGGTMENIYRLATPEGLKTLETVAQLIVNGAAEIKNEFLNLISTGHSLVIDACDGSEIIPGSDDLFKAGIDSDFVSWGANESGVSTPDAPVEVYEMTKDGTFTQLFGSLSGDVGRLYLTQAQIKGFVRKYKNWLRADGWGTFFLFKSNNHFFVAFVHVYSVGSLYVGVYRFGHAYRWHAEYRPRIVVPQLA